MRIVVTTARSGVTNQENLELFLRDTGWEFIPRQDKSLAYLKEQARVEAVVVWSGTSPILYVGEEKFFFHPSMSKNRLVAYRRRGIVDPMIKAFALNPGDSVLDCTLGLGADAVVSSYFSGNGKVLGLENTDAIAYIIRWGMKLFASSMTWLQEAVRRIAVTAADHNDYLKSLPDNSFDIVYFDPMFRHPLAKSQSMSPLRLLADPRPLTAEAVTQACRVARKRVVVKERAQEGEFERLKLRPAEGKVKNKFGYGIIEVNEPH